MQIRMQDAGQWTTEQMRQFLEGSGEVAFQGQGRKEIYAWIDAILRERKYGECGRSGKGLIRRFLGKMSGLSVPQITRLIRQQLAQGTIAARPGQRRRFPTKYSAEDVTRLVEVDRAHQRLSGPATCCILRREFQTFGRKKFERLAALSVSHLYNLRGSAG